MSPKGITNPVSNCCKSPMRAVGGREGTYHFECLACRKACDYFDDYKDRKFKKK